MLIAILVTPPTNVVAEPPSRHLERVVKAAFEQAADGWSVDETLLDDDRRATFIVACKTQWRAVERNSEDKAAVGEEQTGLNPELNQRSTLRSAAMPTEDEFCAAVLHLRKTGGGLAKSSRRDPRRAGAERIQIAAEIAARQMQDELDCHTDCILTQHVARERFDAFARELAPNVEPYLLRKAAVSLRKARRLMPELLSRVTEWKRSIRTVSLPDLRSELANLSERPAIYIFRDETGYLYIGQAVNLRQRMQQHLMESDRVALAKYLSQRDEATIQVELHEFAVGSPAEELRVRRAYESELIRVRRPRLNLAP